MAHKPLVTIMIMKTFGMNCISPMKKTLFTAAALILAAACTRELPESPKNNENLVKFTIGNASGPVMNDADKASGSKTVLANTDGSVVNWTEGDNAILFDNSGSCPGHLFTGNVLSDKTLINLSGELDEGSTAYWLLYPYNSGASMSEGVITTTLSASQTAVAGSFADKTAISMAYGTRTPGQSVASGLSFQNLCPLIAFNMPSYVDGAQSVTLTPNSNTAIAGTISFNASTGAMTAVSGANSITLNGPLAAGERYFIAVAPKTYENGFMLTVTTAGNQTYSASTTKTIDAAPGKVYYLGTLGLVLDATPTVTIDHSYSSNVLTGSTATLNIPVSSELASMIDHWDVTLSKGGKTYRTASSNSGTMSVVDGLTYLPEGTYDISATYFTVDGKHKNLSGTATASAPNLTVGAKIKHQKTDGLLSHSDATLEINVADALASQISWAVRMRKGNSSSSPLCRTSTSANGVMSPSGIYTYLPKGNDYSIEATYTGTDGVAHVINNANPIVSEAPTFTVTTTGYTSYDCYKGTNSQTKSTSNANNCDPNTIYAVSVTVGITTELLSNFSHSQSYKVGSGNDTSFNFPSNSNTYNRGNITNLSWGPQHLNAKVTFDGVEVSATERPLHVTGLPYNATPPSNSGSNPWSAMEGRITWNSDNVELLYTAATYPRIKSPTFHIPNTINVTAATKVTTNNIVKYNILISLNSDSNKVYQGKINKNNPYESTMNTDMTSSKNIWRIQYCYALNAHANVYYFRINYRD